MAHDLRQHLGIRYQLVPPDGSWPYQQQWCNGEEFLLNSWEVQQADLAAWQQTDKIDTVVSIETWFGDHTVAWCRELGMRTILLPMFEAFNPTMDAYRDASSYICVSWKTYQEVPFENRTFIPWPCDVKEFAFRERAGPARTFLHCAGTGGMNGRKGTHETIAAFIKADVQDTQLIVRCQRPLHEICGYDGVDLPKNIKVDYKNTETRAELYEYGDAIIACHKYDGHNLVALEAMACGLPVLTVDAAPMNEYHRSDDPLLVKVGERQYAGMVNPHCLANRVSIDDLAEKIRWCATHDMAQFSKPNREMVEKQYSWDVLHDRWAAALGVS